MAYVGTNTTGWQNLTDGNLIAASFEVFNVALGGWLLIILLVMWNFMSFLKNGKPIIPFVANILTLLFFMGGGYFTVAQSSILVVITVFSGGALFYKWAFKE